MDEGAGGRVLRPAARAILAGLGWACFGLGWLGIFLPGLPTTVFWILAALLFLRTNRKAYGRIIANKRFGESVRLVVEEGRIGRRGKVVSIVAMMGFATLGAVAMRKPAIGAVVVALAAAGSLCVGLMPSIRREDEDEDAKAACAATIKTFERRRTWNRTR